jgi:6-pyruvoyltetrahydropterin/6-carboxytetrahydropterin synthase
MISVFKEFNFDAAHYLPNLPHDHKCRGLHGHSYKLKVVVQGEPDVANGWVLDFADLKHTVLPVISQLDHKLLNEVEGLSNPTCEVLAGWLWNRLKPVLPLLHAIELCETPTSGVIYRG